MSHHRALSGDWEVCGSSAGGDEGLAPGDHHYVSEDAYAHQPYYDYGPTFFTSSGDHQTYDNNFAENFGHNSYLGPPHSLDYFPDQPWAQDPGSYSLYAPYAHTTSGQDALSDTPQLDSASPSACSSELSPPLPSHGTAIPTLHSAGSHNAATATEVAMDQPEDDPSNAPPQSPGEPPAKRQHNRWDGDVYTAKWVKGEGMTRAGWCSICSTWHRLKDSAYWYHMHYSHGISCATGFPFRQPEKSRPVTGTPAREVLCSGCNMWIMVGRPDRWQTTYYRHAYKCEAKSRPVGRSGSRGGSLERSKSNSKSRSPRKAVVKVVRVAERS